MSGPDNETLTAALRRLADERASGLLSVATPGRDVVVELADGHPVSIGPVHDLTDEDDAEDALVVVVAVDDLVDRTVAAIVDGDGDWVWDVSSDADRLPVPPGLVEELARRAVDAAQALAVVGPDDVLAPGHDVMTDGELDRVRALFDGERSLEEVAEAAERTLPAVATMAAALTAAGALALDTDAEDDHGASVSWQDAVRASDDLEDDDEPELWVMEPSDEEELDADEHGDPDPEELDGLPPASTPEPPPPTVTEPAITEPVVSEPPAAPTEDTTDGSDEPVAPAAAAGNWNDTTWLDELSPRDESEDAPPVLAAGDDEPADARAALSSMLQDLHQGEQEPADAPPAAPPPPADSDDDEPDTDDVSPSTSRERREPKAEPGEVAEFLRELSRLALDDD